MIIEIDTESFFMLYLYLKKRITGEHKNSEQQGKLASNTKKNNKKAIQNAFLIQRCPKTGDATRYRTQALKYFQYSPLLFTLSIALLYL